MKKQFVLALFAFAAVSFASCTNDADLNGGKAPGLTEEKEGVGYMSFSLRSETRAAVESNGEKFDEGDVQEYALAGTLNSHVAIFFYTEANTTSEKYFGYSYLTPKDALQNGPHQDANHGTDNNGQYSSTEKLYTYITRDPRVSVNGVNPTSVLLLLNVKPAYLVEIIEQLNPETSTIEDVKKLIGSKDMYGLYKVNGDQYYTMTNSAYVEGGKLKLSADCSNKVSTSPEQAAANPVTVFVERVVAKHSLLFKTNNLTGSSLSELTDFVTPVANSTDDSYNLTVSYVAEFVNETNTPEPEAKTWKVNVVRWGANALERNTFLYKRLEDKNKNLFTYTSAGVNGFGTWWSKDDYLHRSYWAIDPNYNNETTHNYTWTPYSVHEYPAQFRPTYDKSVDSWTNKSIYDTAGTDYEDGHWALDYVSYNEANSTASHLYTLENTFEYEESLKNFGPLRYGTHMLLTAQFLLDDVDEVEFSDKDDETGLIDEVSDKLYADGYYWSKEAYLNWAYKHLSEYVANGVAHMNVSNVFGGADKAFAAAHDEALNTLYVKNGDTYKPIVYKQVDGVDGVLVSDVFELKKAYLENGDGKVALTLKDGAQVCYRVADEVNDDGSTTPVYPQFGKEDIVCLVQAVMPAAAKYYNAGRMYYAIPVKHYSIYKDSFSGLGAASYDDGTLTDTTYELGDFGTVRNHWYSFNITKITKPGTPVDDPDDPIIPNEPEEYDYLGVEIVVLPWHVIDQDVEL